MNPNASAPASTAARASLAFVMPQILIRTFIVNAILVEIRTTTRNFKPRTHPERQSRNQNRTATPESEGRERQRGRGLTTDYADFTDEALAFAQVVFKICFRNLPQPSQSLGTFNLQLATCNVQLRGRGLQGAGPVTRLQLNGYRGFMSSDQLHYRLQIRRPVTKSCLTRGTALCAAENVSLTEFD